MPGPRPDKFTPFVMRVGSEACPRWLKHQLEGPVDRTEPFNRWNIRYALLEGLKDAHRDGGAPTASDVSRPAKEALLPEELWYFERFVNTYAEVFSREPGTTVQHDCDYPTQVGAVNLGGAVDLLLRLDDGTLQLRQLELWGRDIAQNVSRSWELRLALLRLHRAGVVAGSLEVCHIDLNRSVLARHQLEIEQVSATFLTDTQRVTRELQSRGSSPEPAIGSSCAMCSHVSGCPAWDDRHPVRTVETSHYPRYTGRVVQLSPASLEAWLECPRKWRGRYALGLPGWPLGERGLLGLRVHSALTRLHDDGPCDHSEERLRRIATIDGQLDEELLGYLNRHSARCPSTAIGIDHSVTLAELISDGPQAVMVTARIDAIWEHDGMLDCRDYRTGSARTDRVSDDIGAQLQAITLAPLARRRSLKLRLRHEYLSEVKIEDPEFWEPDDDEIESCRDRVSAVALEIASSDYVGVADPATCQRCPYSRACPDSAADALDEELVIVAVDLDDLEVAD